MATKTARKTAKKQGVGRPVGATNKHGFNLTKTIRETVAEKGHFLHQRELVEVLLKKAGKSVTDTDAFSRKVSVLLFAQKTSNKLSQLSVSGSTRDKYYGMPDWLDKNNKPKKGRKPVEAE